MNTEFLNRALEIARNGLASTWRNVATSFKALATSKAVWLACGIVFVGGFWLGHTEGAAGKRALRSEMVKLGSHADQLAATAKSDRAHIVSLEAKGKEMEAEITRLKGGHEPKSEPVAALSRPRVAKAVPRKVTAGEPPKASYWPFSN